MSRCAVGLEALIRRDRLLFVAGLVIAIAIAWVWFLLGAGMDMSAVEMTRMAGMDGWLMQPAVWTPAYAALVFAMWWVMMVAMMLSSATPVLLLFARIHRKNTGAPSQSVSAGVFAAGYLTAWGAFSLVATGMQWGLESTRLMSPMLETTNVWLGAGILIAAGLWQLGPIKQACLRHCHSPLGFLIGNWRAGYWGALRMGMMHGAYCLGCCWFLMALLFFGGVMNLYWIIGLTAYVLLEKSISFGLGVARMTGLLLIASGLILPIL